MLKYLNLITGTVMKIFSNNVNKDAISYLGLWEIVNNSKFKGHEFATFENLAGKKRESYQYKVEWRVSELLSIQNKYIILSGIESKEFDTEF